MADIIIEMNWQTNHPFFLSEGASNRLANPPDRIGAELASASRVKALNCAHETNIAFLNEIRERQTIALISFGDTDDQGQVRFYEALSGLVITLLDPVCQVLFLFRSKQSSFPNIMQILSNITI